MKIFLDTTCLMEEKLSGIGVYTKHLFLSLKSAGQEIIPVYKASRVLKKNRTSHHIGVASRSFIDGPLLRMGGARKVLHGPDFKLLSGSRHLKKIVTVHDIAVFHKGFNSEQFRLSGQKKLREMIRTKRPDQIIVPSFAVKNELEELFPEVKGRVHAIYHGADHILGKSRLEKKLTFTGTPYFLYVGHIENRKNIGGILQAFERFCETNEKTELIIVGKDGFGAEAYHQAIKESPFQERIILKGYVGNDEIKGLYQHALAFVFPSFYEGFGFPIIEAMSMGCPVITSDVGTMKEVAGDSAVLVDPFNAESILSGLEFFFKSESNRAAYVEKGLCRAQDFTWANTAKQVIDVYDL